MQVLAGDVKLAADTFNNFIAVWQKFGVLPERYHYLTAQVHSTERHYPLRPELMESALYLLQACPASPRARRPLSSLSKYRRVAVRLHLCYAAMRLLFHRLEVPSGGLAFTPVLHGPAPAASMPLEGHAPLQPHGAARSAAAARSCTVGAPRTADLRGSRPDDWRRLRRGQATGNPRVLDAAGAMVAGLNAHARVPGGYAAVGSVASMALDDVQPSYFLAETCMYLFLIADPSFLQARPRRPAPAGPRRARRAAHCCRSAYLVAARSQLHTPACASSILPSAPAWHRLIAEKHVCSRGAGPL